MSQSLWNRAGSFDCIFFHKTTLLEVSIPLEQGGVFRRLKTRWTTKCQNCFNPFVAGQGLSTCGWIYQRKLWKSQSLWNRAGSFDLLVNVQVKNLHSVSIPLEQGRVFRRYCRGRGSTNPSLNPFGTGQGLSTNALLFTLGKNDSLNPFGTGQGLSTKYQIANIIKEILSQSLWNRAGSFDDNQQLIKEVKISSQSLWNRAGSFDRGRRLLERY